MFTHVGLNSRNANLHAFRNLKIEKTFTIMLNFNLNVCLTWIVNIKNNQEIISRDDGKSFCILKNKFIFFNDLHRKRYIWFYLFYLKETELVYTKYRDRVVLMKSVTFSNVKYQALSIKYRDIFTGCYFHSEKISQMLISQCNIHDNVLAASKIWIKHLKTPKNFFF